MMKDFISSLSASKKSTPSIQQALNKEKESLEEFLSKHKLPERKGWRPWRF